MDINANRRLLYESKRWSKPIELKGKEGKNLVLQQIIFSARPPFRSQLRRPFNLSLLLNVGSLCQNRLAIPGVSAPPCAMGRKAGRHNQQNNESHATPSRGRRGPIIADNAKRSRATEPELLLVLQFILKISHPIGRFQFCPLAKSMPEAAR